MRSDSEIYLEEARMNTKRNFRFGYALVGAIALGGTAASAAEQITFVSQGGGWTDMCHSILSNENAIAALTTNGNASVKALFPSSQPGGTPGGLLTTTGFPLIDNTGGTFTVPPSVARRRSGSR
jgi:hypothetical protein